MTAQAVGGAVVEYRFRAGYVDATSTWQWVDLQTYSTNTTCYWTPTAAHNYTLVVWAREVGHTASYEAYCPVTLQTVSPVSAVSLTVSPSASQPINLQATFTATVVGGMNNQYFYTASYFDSYGNPQLMNLSNAYSSSNVCNCNPILPNTYTVTVHVRSVGQTSDAMVKSITYTATN